MVVNVFLVAIALPTAKWVLMLDLMLRKVKILFVHLVLAAESAPQYVPGAYSSLKIQHRKTGSPQTGLLNSCR